MVESTYDVVVIGGGPGGYGAALRASQRGKRVALVEQSHVGGTCLHEGCIPSKTLLRSAEVCATVREAASFGVQGITTPKVDFSVVQQRKQRIVQTLYEELRIALKRKNLDIIPGRGRLIRPTIFSPHRGTVGVEQDGGMTTLYAEHIILATGAFARTISGLVVDGRYVLTSREALHLTALPQSMLIVGGGVIGVEWASMMVDFGVSVTLIEAADRILPAEDETLAQQMQQSLASRGVQFLLGAQVDPTSLHICEGDSPRGGYVEIDVCLAAVPARTQRIAVQCILVAVGRVPQVTDMGLEHTDVVVHHGAVQVNEWMQTNEAHMYAIGDVIGGVQLAHAAMHQGEIAADHLCGVPTRPFSVWDVPRCLYGRPEIASIGYTSQQAQQHNIAVDVVQRSLSSHNKSLVHGASGGMIKMVIARDTRTVIGVHLIGLHVTEMIATVSLARLVEATAWEMGVVVYPHPSMAESFARASRAYDWDIQKSMGFTPRRNTV
jgi:dihydrolipoamide dehydrogenase